MLIMLGHVERRGVHIGVRVRSTRLSRCHPSDRDDLRSLTNEGSLRDAANIYEYLTAVRGTKDVSISANVVMDDR